MPGYVPFQNVLEALGASDVRVVETAPKWDFYSVRFRTPAGYVPASYLCLAHDCPQQEASSRNLANWKALSAGGYQLVVTGKSRYADDLSRAARNFGADSATTPRNLLFENVIKSLFPPASSLEEFPYFIEPDVSLPNGEERAAVSYLVDALLPERAQQSDEARAVILIAPAGLGKTTVCRNVARRLITSKRPAIPILVESGQWQNLINLTLPNILSAALLQLVPEATTLTNQKLFQVLVREQLLVPIFDGFDELCLHPNSDYSPSRLVNELLDLSGDTGPRILVTVRETFWDKYGAGVNADRIEQTKLRGFSNDQRNRFFTKRLADSADRDIANRVTREIGSRMYEGAVPQEPQQRDRASGVPLFLELVALYVDGNPRATFAPKTHDPMGPLLEAICDRETERQKLGIRADVQMSIFEELFREYPGDISRDDLRFYVEMFAPKITADAITRFESHAFFSPGSHVRPRFEALRVYFIARWLANRLETAATLDQAMTLVLERNSNGNTDVFDFLVDRFMAMDPLKARSAIAHAFNMIRARPNWEGACSALFHLTQRLANAAETTRFERTVRIFDYLQIPIAPDPIFSKIAVHGQIMGLDLTHLTFEGCVFRDVQFKNCVFDETTRFVRARFDGSVDFENCERPGRASLVDCNCSDDAQRSWETQAGRAGKTVVDASVAREALREALRRFLGPFGFASIKEIDRNAGSILRNPCGDLAWDELLRADVLERHLISGVTGGGLNVSDDAEIRHEIRNFLDNAALGPRLTGVLERIVKRAK